MKTPLINRKTDEELIEMITDGGRLRDQAIRQLYTQTDMPIKAKLSRRGLEQIEIEEIANDAMIVCIDNVCEGKYQKRSSLSTYIVGIADNLTNNMLRKKIRRRLLENSEKKEGFELSPEEIFVHEEMKQSVRDALEKLGPPCNELLLLWANGYPYKEIVEKLDYSTVNSAKVQKFKCLKRLIFIMTPEVDLFDE